MDLSWLNLSLKRYERSQGLAAPDPFGLAAFTPSMGIAKIGENAERTAVREQFESIFNNALTSAVASVSA
jgi:hypothetical protein